MVEARIPSGINFFLPAGTSGLLSDAIVATKSDIILEVLRAKRGITELNLAIGSSIC
jgi:hypothetical protein